MIRPRNMLALMRAGPTGYGQVVPTSSPGATAVPRVASQHPTAPSARAEIQRFTQSYEDLRNSGTKASV
eukprot:4909697-Amphidinium_carterae.1